MWYSRTHQREDRTELEHVIKRIVESRATFEHVGRLKIHHDLARDDEDGTVVARDHNPFLVPYIERLEFSPVVNCQFQSDRHAHSEDDQDDERVASRSLEQ